MDPSKLLIIGSKGQLGKALQNKYPEAKAVDSDELDITSPTAIRSFDWENITHIINAAAYTNVDGAEIPENRKISWAVNATSVALLNQLAISKGITFVHISSDYVFDGSADEHTEDELFSPLSVYGASKAAGDIALSVNPNHYILRTSWVIGEGNNFVRTMIGLAQKDISPTVVNDQIGRLTFTSVLVEAIDHLLVSKSEFGTYNISNSGSPASWADITRKIFELLERNDLTVTDIDTENYYKGKENIAPRPLQSTLNLSKIEATGFKTTDWEENLKYYIQGEVS